MGHIKKNIKSIADDNSLTVKQKINYMLDYINSIARYSYRNRAMGQEELWSYLKTVLDKDKLMVEAL